MQLSDDQLAAFEEVCRFFGGEYDSQYMTLGGHAGTGKTTVIKELVRTYSGATVMAPTGKAAHVLRKKGVAATTIHKMIYSNTAPPGRPPKFQKKPYIGARFIIVDESSMISKQVLEDLLSYGAPILFVGDHGQLEPVGDNPGLMKNPDVRLEKVHRQADGSPIIRFATSIRQGKPPHPEESDGLSVRRSGKLDKDTGTVICGWNQTRHNINAAGRKEYGDATPQAEEPVIFLRNDPDMGVFNGMTANVVECSPIGVFKNYDGIKSRVLDLTVIDDAGDVFRMPAVDPRDIQLLGKWPSPPLVYATEWMDNGNPPRAALCDFAYAITCHKAQGSEWPKVTVIYEKSKLWDNSRWAYTAATRASEHLTFLC